MNQLSLEPIRIDFEALEFELPDQLDNLAALELFEHQVLIAYGDVEEAWDAMSHAYTRAAYHIHMILEHRLWRHRKKIEIIDGIEREYQVYNFQEDYLSDLAQNTMKGFKVSTVKQFHQTIRMYKELGWSREQIENATIRTLNLVSKRIEKDYLTGKPIGLKHGELPPDTSLEDHIIQVTNEVVASPDRPDVSFTKRELEAHLDQKLANRKPGIEFIRIAGKDMSTIQYSYTIYESDGMMSNRSKFGKVQVIWDPEPPMEVKLKFFEKLGIDFGDIQ